MILRGPAIRGLGRGEGFYFVVRGGGRVRLMTEGRLLRVGAGGQPWFMKPGFEKRSLKNSGLVEQD
jgi:hypothetical protein